MVRALTLVVALVASACAALAAYSYREALLTDGLVPSTTPASSDNARAELISYVRSTQCPAQVVGLLEAGWAGQAQYARLERGYLTQIATMQRQGAYTLGAISALLLTIAVVLARTRGGSGSN
jgi:hypothetical protein